MVHSRRENSHTKESECKQLKKTWFYSHKISKYSPSTSIVLPHCGHQTLFWEVVVVWEVVVAQLVERSLSISEVRGSTPVIGKIYIEHLFVLISTVLKRRK